MTAKQTKQLRDKAIKEMQNAPLEVILKAAGMCDGRTIFKPETFMALGLPNSVVEFMTRDHRSNREDWKQTITSPDGQMLDEFIYGLDLMEFMCSAFGLPLELGSAMGWGFRCQQMQQSIKDFCTKSHIAAEALKTLANPKA